MHIIFKRMLTFKQRKRGLRNNFWTLYLGFMKFCIKDKICKIVINISIIHLSHILVQFLRVSTGYTTLLRNHFYSTPFVNMSYLNVQ